MVVLTNRKKRALVSFAQIIALILACVALFMLIDDWLALLIVSLTAFVTLVFLELVVVVPANSEGDD